MPLASCITFQRYMTRSPGKNVDLERLVQQYLSRFKGQPDATRLLLNMLADNVTDVPTLRNHIIRHEFRVNTSKRKTDKSSVVQELSEVYGLSRQQIKEIVGG